MAWAVNAAEMTQRAMTPGSRDVDARAGAEVGEEVVASPTSASAGSTSETSSCSPLRSRRPGLEAGLGEDARAGRRRVPGVRGGGAHAAPLRVRLK